MQRTPAGYLIVENLGRLTRAELHVAVSLLLNIVSADIICVTLQDGQEWTKARLANPADFMLSVMLLFRGHDESNTKFQRIRAVHDKARDERDRSVSGRAPGWLRRTSEQWPVLSLSAKEKARRGTLRIRPSLLGTELCLGNLNFTCTKVARRNLLGQWSRTGIRRLLMKNCSSEPMPQSPVTIPAFFPFSKRYLDAFQGNIHFPAKRQPNVTHNTIIPRTKKKDRNQRQRDIFLKSHSFPTGTPGAGKASEIARIVLGIEIGRPLPYEARSAAGNDENSSAPTPSQPCWCKRCSLTRQS
jgi:hypothetical protein